jgi:hypothetical protein
VHQVTKWELRESLADAYTELAEAPGYTIRGGGIIELAAPQGGPGGLLRLTYDGGYVFPGDAPGPEGSTPLPDDLRAAAVEQAAQWYILRTSPGVSRIETTSGIYWSLADYTFVPFVRQVLRAYIRHSYL